jgi:hypothetical protein
MTLGATCHRPAGSVEAFCGSGFWIGLAGILSVGALDLAAAACAIWRNHSK